MCSETLSLGTWKQISSRFRQASPQKSLYQVLNTLVPYFTLWALMVLTIKQAYPYWITLVLAAAAGGILVRVFIIFHDCCHGSFLASRRANSIVGYVTGVLTFTAFEDWRYAHLRHHATAGNLDRRGVGDIWTMTTDEYEMASRLTRLSYRTYRNPFVLFGVGSILLFLVLNRFAKRGVTKAIRRSVLITNLLILSIVALAVSTIGLGTYLMIQLPVILVGGSVGLCLFYIQHQFEDVYWARQESWDPMTVALRGSSYFKLPKFFQWLTGNIGLHHIHHIQPSIPNYNLQQCYDEVPALRAVKTLTLKTSIHSLSLALYDESKRRLVSFHSLAAE